jgi:putative membrane protein
MVAPNVPAASARAEATHEKIKASAQTIEASELQQVDSADRRTELAADRTVLAAERTYAAWIRTGLAALASGIGARALLQQVVPLWLASATGAILILFAAFAFVAAVWRELYPSVQPPKPRAQRLPRSMLLVVNGFLLLVALAALVGVLFARS